MCFSAGASFGAGAVLAVVGVTALGKVRTRSQIAFASIPLLFSVQQISEGVVWLSLTGKLQATWEPIATTIFLFFAQVVWPLWVPYSIFLLEKNLGRKKILRGLTFIGFGVAAYLGWSLYAFPHRAEIISYHIHYTLNFPAALIWISGLIYILCTVLPPFISSRKRMMALGALIASSYVLTNVFYKDYLISVWCFFAALISMAILFILTRMNRLAVIH
jgi:hypothetical protein